MYFKNLILLLNAIHLFVLSNAIEPSIAIGSCVDSDCSGLVDGGCYCDQACKEFDDCCDDFEDFCAHVVSMNCFYDDLCCEVDDCCDYSHCEVDNSGISFGSCSGSDCFGVNLGGDCYCDDVCKTYDDCCEDVDIFCGYEATMDCYYDDACCGFQDCCDYTNCEDVEELVVDLCLDSVAPPSEDPCCTYDFCDSTTGMWSQLCMACDGCPPNMIWEDDGTCCGSCFEVPEIDLCLDSVTPPSEDPCCTYDFCDSTTGVWSQLCMACDGCPPNMIWEDDGTCCGSCFEVPEIDLCLDSVAPPSEDPCCTYDFCDSTTGVWSQLCVACDACPPNMIWEDDGTCCGSCFEVPENCPSGWSEIEDRCFVYDGTLRNYADSVNYCHEMGGVIASIHSEEENMSVIALFPADDGASVYIGAESDGQGTWSWYDQTQWWQPAQNGGLSGTGETKVAINCPHCNNDKLWHDWGNGDAQHGVICTMPITNSVPPCEENDIDFWISMSMEFGLDFCVELLTAEDSDMHHCECLQTMSEEQATVIFADDCAPEGSDDTVMFYWNECQEWPGCVVCPGVVVECPAGCNFCEITEQTCESCAEAICHDDIDTQYTVVDWMDDWDITEVCAFWGLSPATIINDAENELARLACEEFSDADCILPLSDQDTEGVWMWADGTAMWYDHFSNGEPNDHGSGEDCVQMTNNGYWNDISCDYHAPVLCMGGDIVVPPVDNLCTDNDFDFWVSMSYEFGSDICVEFLTSEEDSDIHPCECLQTMSEDQASVVFADDCVPEDSDNTIMFHWKECQEWSGCVVCPAVVVECPAGCTACEITEQTCESCAEAICHDDIDTQYTVVDWMDDWDITDVCAFWGLSAATIMNDAENELARLACEEFSDADCILPLSDQDTEGVWMWADGTAMWYDHFSNGEPNNYGNGEDCVQMTNNGYWNDISCNYHAPVLCMGGDIVVPPVDNLCTDDHYSHWIEMTEEFGLDICHASLTDDSVEIDVCDCMNDMTYEQAIVLFENDCYPEDSEFTVMEYWEQCHNDESDDGVFCGETWVTFDDAASDQSCSEYEAGGCWCARIEVAEAMPEACEFYDFATMSPMLPCDAEGHDVCTHDDHAYWIEMTEQFGLDICHASLIDDSVGIDVCDCMNFMTYEQANILFENDCYPEGSDLTVMEYWEECHNNQPESTLPAFGEYNDDFSVGGWSTDHKSVCGEYGMMLGGLDFEENSLSKYYQIDSDEICHVTVDFEYIQLDSWDHERAWVAIDDTIMWEAYLHFSESDNKCGMDNFGDNSHHVHLETYVHGGFTLSAGADTDEDAGNENFGISKVRIVTDCSGVGIAKCTDERLEQIQIAFSCSLEEEGCDCLSTMDYETAFDLLFSQEDCTVFYDGDLISLMTIWENCQESETEYDCEVGRMFNEFTRYTEIWLERDTADDECRQLCNEEDGCVGYSIFDVPGDDSQSNCCLSTYVQNVVNGEIEKCKKDADEWWRLCEKKEN